MSLLEEITTLATLARALPGNSFHRRQLGDYQRNNLVQREAIITSVLEIFEGNTWKYVDPMPSESIGEARSRVGRYERRLLFSFMNTWNTLYTQEPNRVFKYDGERLGPDNKPEVLELLQEEYRKASVDDVMEQSDTLLRLTGNVALRPWYDANNKELVIHMYSGNNIRVVNNSDNPRKPLAIALVGNASIVDSKGTSIAQHSAEFFTDTEAGVVKGEESKVEPLETKRIPVALGWDRFPTNKTGFYVNAPGIPLAAIDRLMANDFTSQLGFITLMQGFGIPVAWGLKPGTELRIGPDKFIEFDGDPDVKEDFEFKNPNAPLEEMSEVLNKLIDWTREDYGIPKTMLDASTSPSGASQVEANAPVEMMRQKRAKRMRPLESNTVLAIADVLIASGVLAKGLDPKLFSVSVSYPAPRIAKDTSDQIAEDRFDLGLGLITPGEIFMRKNPDKFDSVEEADEFIRQRQLTLVIDVDKGASDVESPAMSEDPVKGSNSELTETKKGEKKE